MTREEKLERAGEYALGLLEGPERQVFEAEMARDAELAAMVGGLAARLQSLDDTVVAADAGPGLWAEVARRIDTIPQLPPPAANTNERRTLPRWASMAASVLVALGVGYFCGQALTPKVPQPTMVAVLINEGDQSPGAIVEAFGDDSVRIVPLVDFTVPAGSVLQVWTLPDADTGPVSLGTLDAAADMRLRGPDLPLPTDGQLYEITLEPAPGSPTGRPTGPILVKGFAKAPI
jgi:anti-sigma-K factor RskA